MGGVGEARRYSSLEARLAGTWLESQHSGKLRQDGHEFQHSLRLCPQKNKTGEDGSDEDGAMGG